MINGLVITHGGIGDELIRVVELIMGPQTGLSAMSNNGLSAADLIAGLEAWLDANADPERGVVLFVDDFGGSCARAAQLADSHGGGVRILTGLNLAMLLDFLTWREGMELDELARRLVEKGREAILIIKQGGDLQA